MPGAPDAATILTSIPNPMLGIDPANVIAFANDAAESFLHRSRARLEGRTVDSILRSPQPRIAAALIDREENISAQDALFDLGERGQQTADLVIAPIVGESGWRIIMLTPRPGDRDHIGQVAKPGEQAARGAQAVLGHEIKNPLAGIRGAAQLLARQGDAAQQPLVSLIVSEVDRIAAIIDQMQYLGARTPLTLRPANVHALINRALQSVRAANPGMPAIAMLFDPSLPDVVVDEGAMLQILTNLIQNAIDALAGRDAAMIRLQTRFVMGGALRQAGDGDGGRPIKLPVEVTVIDNGPGVPASIRADLFAPFVTTRREGQGLGLAIVRKLVRDMNGRIVHERDEREGLTQFRLFLPIEAAA